MTLLCCNAAFNVPSMCHLCLQTWLVAGIQFVTTALGVAGSAMAIKGFADYFKLEVKCMYFDAIPDDLGEAAPRCIISSPR